MGHRASCLAVAVFAFAQGAGPSTSHAPDAGRALTFEDRVAAQRAIEEVYWRHRIWPPKNPGPKPALDAVMPESAIRAKVEDYLKKSKALEKWWRRAITGEQLQAELDRMARDTRDPRLLRELFDALGGDASLIAETLARQTLAERLIRNRYATDERFHAAVKSRAEEARARCEDAACMKEMSGQYHEATAKLDDVEVVSARSAARDVAVSLDAQHWNRHIDRLTAKLGGSSESIPLARPSGVEETTDAFVVTAVLSRRDKEIVTATVSWPKRSFDAWWGARRATLSPQVEQRGRSFTLPDVAVNDCVNDTWAPTHHGFPDFRNYHTAVWTGTEMIVWGGAVYETPGMNTGGRYNPSTDTWTATSVGPNVPSARWAHTAVWTGTEMIVWGGAGNGVLNTGGRYDPTTDSWTATSVGPSVPSARWAHTAVWTGTEMIIWGGAGSQFLNTGGRYNPTANSWTATSMGPNVPSVRYFHKAVWTGTEMIVWGGSDGAALPVTGGRYNPTTNTWTATSNGSNAPLGRFGHTAVWTGVEMIVWGGRGIDLTSYLNTGGRYNPTTDTWAATSTGPNAPAARADHTAVWTETEMIVWGGEHYEGGSFYSSDTGGRYRPTTDTWTATSIGEGVASVRQEHTAVWTGTEMIVWGGWGDSADPNDGSPLFPIIGGRYDPATDSWTPTSTEAGVPALRSDHAAVWTGTEMIVWGGWDGDLALNSGGRYCPVTDNWTPTSMGANVPSPRVGPTAAWTGTELIVWGGSNSVTGGRYNPTTDTWTATSIGPNVPVIRWDHTAVWTGTEMIVWGGWSYDGSAYVYLNTGGRYDPSTDLWTPTSTGANVPTGRSDHSAVWTGSEMLVWGGEFLGYPPSQVLNTGGRYDPATDLWTPTSTGTDVPVERRGHSAVWTGAEMIVWGGDYYDTTSQYFNTGGRYDPTTDLWTPTSTSTDVPVARRGHSAVWTGAEMIVWGGADQSGRLSTGGRYDPTTDRWTGTSTGTFVPSGRQQHTAVWTGAEMIVWGGNIPTSTGGRYCACPDGRIVYRDADGDGYGDLGVSVPSCDGSIPVGYVIDAADCDDTDAGVEPGATEACNGIDDDCDTVVDEGWPAVPGVPALQVDNSGTNAILYLTAAGGERFDVLKGSLFDLRQTKTFSGSLITCLADDTAATTIFDPNGGGVGRYYVVRESGCSGAVGSYNSGSPSQHHDRDADIATSSVVCP